MDSRIEYEKNLPLLMALQKEDVKNPPYPVEDIVGEALDLAVTATEDREKLLAVGLDESHITEMASKAVTLRYAEAIWTNKRGEMKEAEEEWKANKKDYKDFKACTVHDFLFAYRNDASNLDKIRAIADQKDYHNMVQGLTEMYIIGASNPAPLEAIRFDMSKLEKCRHIADHAGELLALVNGEKGHASEAKDIRDRAYIFLSKPVKTVREYGQYVFWRDPKRKEKYTSKLQQNKNNKQNDSDTPETEE